MARKPPFGYVNIHGQPLDRPGELRRPAPLAASRPATPPPPRPVHQPTPADLEAVYDTLCVAGSPRGKTFVMNLLRGLGHRAERGARLSLAEVTLALDALCAAGRITLEEDQGYAATDAAARRRRDELLGGEMAPAYARLWLWAHGGAYGEPVGWRGSGYIGDPAQAVAWLRLLVYGRGVDDPKSFNLAMAPVRGMLSVEILAQALCEPFSPALFERLSLPLRMGLLSMLGQGLGHGAPVWRPLRAWLDERLAKAPEELPASLRMTLAEGRLHRGDIAGMEAALAGLQSPALPLFAAARLAQRGQWAEAAAAYAEAYKELCKVLGRRRNVAPYGLLWLYALALAAQPTVAAWTQARKFCVAESGSRTPEPFDAWGLWAHALGVRLGNDALDPAAFTYRENPNHTPAQAELLALRLLLAAWLGHRPSHWTHAAAARVLAVLEDGGQWLLADLARQAAERLELDAAPSPRAPVAPLDFFGSPRENWRDALAAITALGETRGGAGAAALSTLQWRVTLATDGSVEQVEPWEPPASARGKAKPVPLARLKKDTRLDPRDAAVARSFKTSPYSRHLLEIDTEAAALALVNHPGVVFADAPTETVELREGLPELEVLRRRGSDLGSAEHFVFRLLDPVGGGSIGSSGSAGRSGSAVRIVREGGGRAKLIRVTPAQRRVAELVAQEWQVPAGAQAELEAALRVLGGHFQLHSDAAAGQAMPCESRLRAQLTPDGGALRLRLVVRPFGDHGPLVTPGVGRARLLTLHEGLQLCTERALQDEAAHLAAVLEALPWLGAPEHGDASWFLDDPEDALRAVEQLPALPAVAGLDWPRGKAVQVRTAAPNALKIKVASSHDWFAVDGELQLDEQRVLGLRQLLALVREARGSRFVALGEGDYLALTERLRRQLADLDAVGQPDKQGLKLPAAAAGFLAETLDATALAGDKPWARRIAALNEAAALNPEPPPALQAQLRAYQLEGYAWMARLAHAGLGAVLADDMGLGKTVQTLALLLARAAEGPALVVAPTSVCGNWVAETERFAPGLRVLAYGEYSGEGERATLLQQAGPFDLVVASYALVQGDAEAFAAQRWHTLVLDEAQALKNAATKRAQAVATLQAGFRLALTGTPVENRLADLWSIMNLLNPGLLGNAAQFQQRFAAAIERQRDDGARERLKRLVAPFLLRRSKAQVLTDLPPRTEIVHRVEPGAEERAFLEAMRRDAVQRIATVAADAAPGQAAFHMLAELTRLRRAACDPRLVAPELGRIGAKAQEFEQLALELVAGRHKALVFSQFTDFLKLLGERLDAAGISYQYLDGSTPGAERTRRVNAFQQGQGDLFLISLKAGGFGLNLTAADYVLIVDPWWNPAAEDQALGRAHRIGQLRPVTVYRLVTAGSIEERIVEMHRDKRALADGLLEGQDQGRPIGADELRELLAPAETPGSASRA
ncbi:MAG: DEAD/DEAH box helicase [Betaproteobacteria bacterium]|nr:DEAD/DEAH box helicase [Betaproteobacteria bacterium]